MVSAVYTGGHSSGAAPENPPAPTSPQRLTRQQQADLIAWVQVWHDAGCAVHPARADGSKVAVSVAGGSPDLQPDVFPDTYQKGRWAGQPHPRAGQANPEAGQHDYGWGRIATGAMPRLTPAQVAAIIRTGRADGIGVFCGLASGGLEMVEVEGRARELLPAIRAAAERLGHLPLLERLAAGCVEESPSGGLHFVLRVTDGPALGNTPLAARPDPTAEHGRLVLAETRGQGGWFVCAPSAGRTHKSGKPYSMVRGGPSTIPSFTVAERDALYACFRAVDEMPAPDPVATQSAVVARRDRPDGDILPGDDFNQRATWDEILIPAGWTRLRDTGDRTHWNKPGKSDGRTRATTTGDVLYVFATSASLPPGKGLSKFTTYAHLNHAGDFTAAARALWDLGYGSRRQDDGGDDGDQPRPVEPRPAPVGPRRSLDDWRQEAAARRAVAVEQPGLHLDASPTGSGKTHATNAALARASSSLTVLPTHANVQERVVEMRTHGIDAVAFPELSPETCQDYSNASRAQSLGLVAGAAVCPSCPFKDGCTYQAGVKSAQSAQHRVATHERLRRSSKAAEGVQVVVVDESPELVLAPTLTVSVKQVTPVETLAHAIRNHWYSTATADQKSFAGVLLEVVAAIHAACGEITTAGTRKVDLALAHDVPKHWQRLLYQSIQSVGVASTLDADALTLVTKAAAGELVSLEIVTDLTRAGRLHHFVVGSWRPSMPADAAVILLDATGNADDIAAVVQQPVDDCTPEGHLPAARPIVQIPDDISRSTSAAAVAGHVEAFLAAHPEVQRLGIIGHKPHVEALIDADQTLLGTPARERVAKWCWFGQGPDRASNDWHQTCDHLLVLGTPRANPGDYRRWLVQHGLHGAAGMVDGDWGPRDWQAETVDGKPVTVAGMGYRNQDWHRAYTAVSRAALHQSVGRGRAILPDGIPVTVLTCEPTTYPIAPSLETTPAAARETAEIVRRMGQQDGLPLGGASAKVAIGIPYRDFCANGWFPAGDCLRAIMAAASIDRRAAQVRLAQCLRAGLLTRPRRGWYALPESADAQVTTPAAPPVAEIATCNRPPAAPDCNVQSPPPVQPATVQPPVQAVVISAAPPTMPTPVVDVVAASPPESTTTTCTSTVRPSDAPAFNDLLALIDERAAIMEHDGGLDRETADRLAREMVLGRDAATVPPAPPVDAVLTVDHAALKARAVPYVQQALAAFPGVVQVIDDRRDPFATTGRRATPRRPGQCVCGHDDRWVQIPIHGGQSVRVDCGHCDRFGWFAVWRGRRLPGPSDDPPPPADAEAPIGRDQLSFLPAAPPVTGPAVLC
jgi:hypothetical protein